MRRLLQVLRQALTWLLRGLHQWLKSDFVTYAIVTLLTFLVACALMCVTAALLMCAVFIARTEWWAAIPVMSYRAAFFLAVLLLLLGVCVSLMAAMLRPGRRR